MKPSATKAAQKLINDNPHLFKDNAETLLAIGTALIKYAQEVGEMLFSLEVLNSCGIEMDKIDES